MKHIKQRSGERSEVHLCMNPLTPVHIHHDSYRNGRWFHTDSATLLRHGLGLMSQGFISAVFQLQREPAEGSGTKRTLTIRPNCCHPDKIIPVYFSAEQKGDKTTLLRPPSLRGGVSVDQTLWGLFIAGDTLVGMSNFILRPGGRSRCSARCRQHHAAGRGLGALSDAQQRSCH